MPWIWYRRTSAIGDKSESARHGIITRVAEGPFTIRMPSTIGRRSTSATLSADGKEITTVAEFDVSAATRSNLSERIDPDTVSTDERRAIFGPISELGSLAADVMNMLHQESKDPRFLPTGIIFTTESKDNQWSSDGEVWASLRYGRGDASVADSSAGVLTTELALQVEAMLAIGEEPLVAMFHHWESYRAGLDRFRWSEATIAAELAVKEILLRIEPTLELVLLDLPSPPLEKLYRITLPKVLAAHSPLLQHYLPPDWSEQLKFLKRGSEKRNNIDHNPARIDFENMEVESYANAVGRLIHELLWIARVVRDFKVAGVLPKRERRIWQAKTLAKAKPHLDLSGPWLEEAGWIRASDLRVPIVWLIADSAWENPAASIPKSLRYLANTPPPYTHDG